MQLFLLSLTTIVLLLSLLYPPFLEDQILQHIPTFAAIGTLAVAVKKQWLSTTAFSCVIAFLWLHILGARYIYSNVPYDDWAHAALGTSFSARFDWERNHYDRLVHLCFGFLFVIPAKEVAERRGNLGRWWAVAFAICFVTTLSAVYEVVEWLLTLALSPEAADGYNGQQGDPWDAQKDMALALVGSFAMAVWIRIVDKKTQP